MEEKQKNKINELTDSGIYARFYSFFLLPLMITIFGVMFFLIVKFLTFESEDPYDLLNNMGQQIDSVLVLDVNHEEIVKRLSSRWSCKECDTVYNLLFDPPASEDACDKCESVLYQRDDDKPETIRQRLEVYSEQTSPLIDFYTHKGLVKTINGAGKIYEVKNVKYV